MRLPKEQLSRTQKVGPKKSAWYASGVRTQIILIGQAQRENGSSVLTFCIWNLLLSANFSGKSSYTMNHTCKPGLQVRTGRSLPKKMFRLSKTLEKGFLFLLNLLDDSKRKKRFLTVLTNTFWVYYSRKVCYTLQNNNNKRLSFW